LKKSEISTVDKPGAHPAIRIRKPEFDRYRRVKKLNFGAIENLQKAWLDPSDNLITI